MNNTLLNNVTTAYTYYLIRKIDFVIYYTLNA